MICKYKYRDIWYSKEELTGMLLQQQVDTFTFELLKAVIESSDLKNKIELIRSGGQTGFDEAGIKAGIKLGIPTLVLAPKGWTFRVDLERFNSQYRGKVQNYKINNNNSVDISNEEQFKDRFKEKVDSIIKISKPTKSKKLQYSLFSKILNKNQTKSGYKLTIPEFPNAEVYITNESYGEEGNTKRREWQIEVMSKGSVMTFPTPFATTLDEVINKFTIDINEKYSKKQETLSVLKEIGIDLQKNEESDGTDQLPEKC